MFVVKMRMVMKMTTMMVMMMALVMMTTVGLMLMIIIKITSIIILMMIIKIMMMIITTTTMMVTTTMMATSFSFFLYESAFYTPPFPSHYSYLASPLSLKENNIQLELVKCKKKYCSPGFMTPVVTFHVIFQICRNNRKLLFNKC